MTLQEVVWLFFGGIIGVLSTYAITGAVVWLPKLARRLAVSNRAAVVIVPRRG